MSERPGTSEPPQLPDFSGGASIPGTGTPGTGGGPGGSGGSDGVGGPSGPSAGHGGTPGGGGGRGPIIAVALGGVGVLVVVLAIVALVFSQTVFSTDAEDPTAAEETSAADDPEETRPEEYVPSEEATDEAGGAEPTFTEQPTTECTVHEDNNSQAEQSDGTVRSGGLEFAVQPDWGTGSNWGSQSSYMVDVAAAEQEVEDGWYSVAAVGAVEYPEDEGGYPGVEDAARAIFQCGISRDQAQEIYGPDPELENYRDEALTVDGHDGWIVTATVMLSDLSLLDTTESWEIAVIVVDTPEGPAAFDGGAATGHEQQVADLQAMIDSLSVA
ncbi:hypothetical protein ACFQS2_09545 [Brachybacterium sp. GCM10030267]|uniref:hypothetical protein n=1 Tax=Brachybacterium sp. GCM10030267 TaxID=3273381 RepID=UPI003605AB81